MIGVSLHYLMSTTVYNFIIVKNDLINKNQIKVKTMYHVE